ncbi:MAG: ribosome maturation factor RimP [Candidatus Lambdaproteobacteria bacterium]|nr:ribosome maturation factor RimP [Candidatus Lambdaproteobacteria bacterium]
MATQSEIEGRIEGLIAGPLEALGSRVLDVQYRFEQRWVLRVAIDREGGVTLEDCTAASELIGRLLDVEDPLPSGYTLEVTSPGVFRPLSKAKHFVQSVGRIARVHLAARALPEVTSRQVRGTIVAVEAGDLVMACGGQTVRIPLDAVRAARLDPDL